MLFFSSRMQFAGKFLLPVLLILLIYWQVGFYEFVWDDLVLFVRNHELRTDEWMQPLSRALQFSDNYYRPLVLLVFAAELHLFNVDPGAMHWVNLLVHVLNTLAVVFLAQQLATRSGASGSWAPLLAGLFYASHPALVEATSWVAGRFDQFVTLFMLLGLVAAGSLKRGPSRSILIAVCFLAAALSKEVAVIFPVMLMMWFLLLSQEKNLKISCVAIFKQERALFGLLVLTGFFYLGVRQHVLGYLLVSDSKTLLGTPLQHLLLVSKAFFWYLYLTFWPFSVSAPFHEAPTPISESDIQAWVGVVFLALLFLMMWFFIFVRKSEKLGLMLLMYFLSISPLLHIIKPMTIGANIVHERFLTFPLAIVAVCFGVFAKYVSLPKLRPVIIFVFSIWIPWASINSSVNTTFWRSNIVLWSWVVKNSPGSYDALNNLAAAYIEKNLTERALPIIVRVMELAPVKPEVLGNYATLLHKQGKHEEALAAYFEIRERFGENSGLLNNIGNVLMSLRRFGEAESYYHSGLALSPTNWLILSNLYRVLVAQNKDPEAEVYLVLARKYAPPGSIVIGE